MLKLILRSRSLLSLFCLGLASCGTIATPPTQTLNSNLSHLATSHPITATKHDLLQNPGNPWQRILGKTTAPRGWQVRPCPGEAPFLCVVKQDRPIGSVLFQQWNLAQYPKLQAELHRLGLTPGQINYANPEHKAKVLAALRVIIADYYATIRADRLTTYGTRFGVMEQPPLEISMGQLPGLTYGFSSISKTGIVHERYVSYIAFDGEKHLYIIVTGFDPAAATNTLNNLTNLNLLVPHLRTIVTNLKIHGG